MRVLIDDTIYVVIEENGNEVCVLKTYELADGLKRQYKTWIDKYKIISSDD